MAESRHFRSSSADIKNRNPLIMTLQPQQRHQTQHPTKKFYPKQKFGVSAESPTYFHLKNTLVADHGYKYKMDQHKNRQNYIYMSQKHFITLGAEQKFAAKKEKTKFTQQFQNGCQNKKAFHRKKGRLSQFIDKNGWMGDRYKVLGIQRSQSGRQLRKSSRQDIVNKIRENTKQRLSNRSSKKMNKREINNPEYPSHENFKNLLLAEKLKISKQKQGEQQQRYFQEELRPRSMLNSRKDPQNNSIFKITTSKFKPKSGHKNQYIMNVPEWNQADFKMNFIEWDTNPNHQNQNNTIMDTKRPSTISTGFRSIW